MPRNAQTTKMAAEIIAINGLQYLAGDEQQLSRFLALSGCDPTQLRENAGSPDFLAGVLEYFMGNEPTLLAFCAHYSINPEDIVGAHEQLEGNIVGGRQTDGGEF